MASLLYPAEQGTGNLKEVKDEDIFVIAEELARLHFSGEVVTWQPFATASSRQPECARACRADRLLYGPL